MQQIIPPEQKKKRLSPLEIVAMSMGILSQAGSIAGKFGKTPKPQVPTTVRGRIGEE